MDFGSGGWADDDDTIDPLYLPSETVEFDKSGHKVITSYRLENGEKQKITRKFKVITKKKKVAKSIKERREWTKFGLSKGCGPGPEEETTILSRDELRLEKPGEEEKAAKRAEEELLSKIRNRASTRKFKMDQDEKRAALMGTEGAKPGGLRTGTALSEERSTIGSGAPGKYVAPRGAMSSGGGGGREEEQNTLRVTNISEDTNEDDLRDLFSPFGRIQRVYLAKDRETQQSRGFAYISFAYRDHAEKAMEKLSGFGYDHLILKVEWAKPSTKDDIGSQSVMKAGIVSGYGGALPQGLG